jgi:energy-coupling factor transport system ATP-binding protein
MSVALENVTLKYKGSMEPALENINLMVEEGTIVGIIGLTGAGKTSLLLTLNGIIPSHIPAEITGRIIVDGIDTKTHSIEELCKHVGLVLDDPSIQIITLSVEEDVSIGPANFGLPLNEIKDRVRFALDATRLVGFEKRDPRSLSGGEQQALAIAGVLAMRPRILALDEPVIMLDPLGKARIFSVIKELNKQYGTTVIVTDSGEQVEELSAIADEIIILHEGKIIERGAPNKVFLKRDVIEGIGLRVPQITRLAYKLGMHNLGRVPTKLEEYECIADLLKRKRVVPPIKVENPRNYEEGGKPIITVKNLYHVYPGPPPIKALNGVNLTIYEGEFVALIGQNGSGKTTLAYHLVGILKPSNPDAVVIVDGINVPRTPINEVIKHINYVFQNPRLQLFSETFGDEVAYGPKMMGLPKEEVEKRVEEALSLFGLERFKDSPQIGLTRKIETFLAAASIIAMKPKIIIFDEPTGRLDELSLNKFMEVLMELRKKGHTIIIITHDMELAALADRVVVMNQGQVLMQGHPKDVFSKSSLLEKVWLKPPQITQLAQKLGELGVPQDILTVEEFYDFITQNPLLGGGEQ